MNIQLNKEYTINAFIQEIGINKDRFYRDRDYMLSLLRGHLVYDYYQKNKNSNRYYIKVTQILTSESDLAQELSEIKSAQTRKLQEVKQYVSNQVDTFVKREKHTNGSEIGRKIYYQLGNPYNYAESSCKAQARADLKEHYIIDKGDCKWRAKVSDEEDYIDMTDEEIQLFKRLWRSSENTEMDALDLELFQEGEISEKELAQGRLARYINAKNEFRIYTGKYPFYIPARCKNAW